MKKFALLLIPCLLNTAPIVSLPDSVIDTPRPIKLDVPPKSPIWAATLSSLFPGLGQAYLGDRETAAQMMSMATATLALTATSYSMSDPAILQNSLATFQSATFYSVYAAYRDAKIYNGMQSQSCRMPTDSFSDLSTAPFRWRVLKKPEVWGGLLAALGLAVGATYCYDRFVGKATLYPKCSSSHPLSPAVALPIGIGEEAYFHGYLQTQLAESFSPTTGIVVSGLLFGAAHIPNAFAMPEEQRWGYYAFSLPLITTFGTYTAWLTNKNHSLQEGVAIHSWYDFVLFSIEALSNQWAATGKPGIAFTAPF